METKLKILYLQEYLGYMKLWRRSPSRKFVSNRYHVNASYYRQALKEDFDILLLLNRVREEAYKSLMKFDPDHKHVKSYLSMLNITEQIKILTREVDILNKTFKVLDIKIIKK